MAVYTKNVTRFAVPMTIDTLVEKLLDYDGEVGCLLKVLEKMPSLIELKIEVYVIIRTPSNDRQG